MNPVILADSRYRDAVPAATDTAAGYDVLNIRDRATYTLWRAASAGTKYITVDCGAAATADTLLIVRHNLGTAVALVSVESSSDNFAADVTERLAGFTPADDSALMKLFNAATARYWRIKIVTAAVAPELAVLELGQRMEIPEPAEPPLTIYTRDVLEVINKSMDGQLLGADILGYPFKVGFRSIHMDMNWIASTWLPFMRDHYARGFPVGYAPMLDAFPDAVYYGRRPRGRGYDVDVTLATRADQIQFDMEGVLI